MYERKTRMNELLCRAYVECCN